MLQEYSLIRSGLAPVLLLGALLSIGCVREKDLLDEKVRKLCAVDGGIKIYEQVVLPEREFDEFGEVRVPSRLLATSTDRYFYEAQMHFLQNGDPSMWRSHYKLIRRADDKVLGESIVYSRRGGDFPGPWHESSFGCPTQADIKYVNARVFVREDKGK